eukprot:Rmarinus@m.8484
MSFLPPIDAPLLDVQESSSEEYHVLPLPEGTNSFKAPDFLGTFELIQGGEPSVIRDCSFLLEAPFLGALPSSRKKKATAYLKARLNNGMQILVPVEEDASFETGEFPNLRDVGPVDPSHAAPTRRAHPDCFQIYHIGQYRFRILRAWFKEEPLSLDTRGLRAPLVAHLKVAVDSHTHKRSNSPPRGGVKGAKPLSVFLPPNPAMQALSSAPLCSSVYEHLLPGTNADIWLNTLESNTTYIFGSCGSDQFHVALHTSVLTFQDLSLPLPDGSNTGGLKLPAHERMIEKEFEEECRSFWHASLDLIRLGEFESHVTHKLTPKQDGQPVFTVGDYRVQIIQQKICLQGDIPSHLRDRLSSDVICTDYFGLILLLQVNLQRLTEEETVEDSLRMLDSLAGSSDDE